MIFWCLEQSRCFSVKSCYYALTKLPHGSPITYNYLNQSWKNVWDILVPPRVQLFLWKVATNSLLTLSRLRQRYVDVELLCPLCHDSVEDSFHALFGCALNFLIWNKLFSEGWPSNININDWWIWLCGKGIEWLQNQFAFYGQFGLDKIA